MKRLFTLLIVLCVSSLAYAQTDVRTRGSGGGQDQPNQPQTGKRRVNGRIVDANGEPMVGATVTVLNAATKNVVTGGFTNANGEFDLQADATGSQLLRVNYVGYKIQEVSIDAQSAGLNISMQEDVLNLDEVVVTGYTSQSRRDVLGSVSKVSGQDIQDIPVAGIDQALQGRAAGVLISQNSGTPGVGVSVRIRGLSSISASNAPLYVIDGVPVTTGDFSQLGFGGQSVNALTDINPNDIESMEVLKDAASAAIYGSRAANGVIFITTKRGASRKAQVNVNMYVGWQSYWKNPKFLNSTEYLTILREANVNEGFVPASITLDQFNEALNGTLPWGTPATATSESNSYGGVSTDWISTVSRNAAAIANYDFNVSGGDEKFRFYLGGGWFDQFGVVIGSRYQRMSGRLNLDYNVSSKFSVSLSAQISRSLNDRMVSDNTLFGPFANALASSPLWPVTFGGAYTRPNFFYSNPVAEALENDDITTNYRNLMNITGKYQILPELNLSVRLGADVLSVDERRYTPNTYPGSSAAGTNGSATNATSNAIKWLIEVFAEYRKTFAADHNFKAVVGASRERNDITSAIVTGQGFAGNAFRYVASAAVVNSGSNAFTQWGIQSYFARLDYDYKAKYLLGVTVRADASSRFGPNNRWGYFPGVSVGWRIKEESFLKDVDFVSELKLRASWGINGNQEIGNFGYRTLFGPSIYLDQAGIAPSQLGDPSLKWETTTSFNFGVDAGLFKGRLNVSVDYYVKTTRDLLFNRAIPAQTGFTGFLSNIGSVENRGMDFTISGSIFEKPNNGFRWKADLNISFYRNKILSLFKGQDQLYGFGGNSIILREGQPIGMFYGWISDGVYSRTSDVPAERQLNGVTGGDINFRDLNGDNVITDADLTITGNPHPDYFGGLTNTFSFKGFDMQLFFQFSMGNKIWDATGNFTQALGAGGDDNMRSDVLGRWQQEGDVTNIPRATAVDANNNRRANSSRFVGDGSYLRLKNAVLGYTLPKEILNKIRVRTFRVYVQAQNLFTFTRYPGFDPEVNFAGNSNTTIGVDFYTVPQFRTFSIGCNIGF